MRDRFDVDGRAELLVLRALLLPLFDAACFADQVAGCETGVAGAGGSAIARAPLGCIALSMSSAGPRSAGSELSYSNFLPGDA